MPFVSIAVDVQRALDALGADAKKQAPFAAARAVTQLAFAVQRAERAGMTEVFAHPRPFTQRSVLVGKADKASQTATVYIRPEAAEYLAPYETGGLHHLPGKGVVLLNPKGLQLDRYGQIRGRPRAIADRKNVFAGTVQTKDGPIWGFWQRLAGKNGGPRLKLLVRAGDALAVHKSLHFVDRARALIQAQGATAFRTELSKALANAKR
jgi:hypothetical protein